MDAWLDMCFHPLLLLDSTSSPSSQTLPPAGHRWGLQSFPGWLTGPTSFTLGLPTSSWQQEVSNSGSPGLLTWTNDHAVCKNPWPAASGFPSPFILNTTEAQVSLPPIILPTLIPILLYTLPNLGLPHLTFFSSSWNPYILLSGAHSLPSAMVPLPTLPVS